MIPTED